MKYLLSWLVIYFWLTPILNAHNFVMEDCAPPILSAFSNPNINGFTLHWIDFNPDILHYELEIVEKNSSPSEEPDFSMITTKFYTVNNLLSGTAYDCYIRSVCSSGISDWNGPFSYNTAIKNGDGCSLSLNMKDDNCPGVDSFFIEVDVLPLNTLGNDVLLEKLSLIIEHPWVADLKLILESPEGTKTTLSSHHGIGKPNYGNPIVANCFETVTFNDLACESINEFNYPYLGTFLPDEPLSIFHNGQNPNGQWKLLICDRVQGDVGKLEHIELYFTNGNCRIPDSLFITNVNESSVDIEWNLSQYCDSLQLIYGPVGFNPENGLIKMISCIEGSGNITGLEPNFAGEFYYTAICAEDTIIRPCSIPFTTECAAITLGTDFDSIAICQPGCNNECPVDSIWNNTIDDGQNWYVFTGPTSTDFTGPKTDFHGNGNYIYMESSSIECQENAESVLRTSCLYLPEDQSNCSFSFKAFLFGVGVNKLVLQLSLDGGNSWIDVDSLIGNQTNSWIPRSIDLSGYSDKLIQLQFVAFGGFDQFGDIALDELYFHGAMLASEMCYFKDLDNDGFGNVEEMLCLCSSSIPEGYVNNNEDCNDLIELINPNATEIPCNLIDENCNGEMDDHEGNDIIFSDLIELNKESCNGSIDGSIEIELSGGLAPYEVIWSNGDTGLVINNLQNGIYTATVTDATACQTQLDEINLGFFEVLAVDLNTQTEPTCPGVEDGSILANIEGGLEPYSYLWNTGDTSAQIVNITSGEYQLTVFDQNNCSAESALLFLNAPNPISAGIQLKNNVLCNGGNEGYIVLGAFGGQAPYSFEWEDGSTSNILQDLSAGFYSCTINDQAGCETILDSLEITQPSVLELNLDALDNPICFDESGGSIEVSASGGTPPYSFFWSNGDISDDVFLLSPGNYSVTVYDAKACQASLQNLQIIAPAVIEIEVLDQKNTSCPGASDGQIILQASGGGGIYNYFWSNGAIVDDTLQNIPIGDYNVVVVDQFGCKSRLDNIEIKSDNKALEVVVGQVTEPQCFGDNDGEINIYITEAEIPIDVNWSSGQKKELFQLSDKITQLESGSYQVTITDNYGCIGISEIVILPEWEALSYNIVEINDISCFGLEDGYIEIEAIGGNPPYKYFWDNGSSFPLIENLSADSYKLLIIDDNSCSVFTSDLIIEEPELLSTEIMIQPSINGEMNGSASVFPEGGTLPYEILWDENTNFQTGTTANNLASGVYSVSIYDANQCFLDTLVEITNIVGVESVELFTEIRIKPNPVINYLEVQVDNCSSNNLSIGIYNSQGELHMDCPVTINDGQFQLDVEVLKSGLYFIKFTDQETKLFYISKFIKSD